jgi:hypothetical protein
LVDDFTLMIDVALASHTGQPGIFLADDADFSVQRGCVTIRRKPVVQFVDQISHAAAGADKCQVTHSVRAQRFVGIANGLGADLGCGRLYSVRSLGLWFMQRFTE